MGKKEKKAIRVVLDTNIIVSALLFKGELSKIVDLWKKGKIIPSISRETFEELKDVLEYPKFSLSNIELKTLVEEEILPFFEVVEIKDKVSGICRDPHDDKFISCAISSSADFIVSGDKDLCRLGKFKSIRIMNVKDFMKMFGS